MRRALQGIPPFTDIDDPKRGIALGLATAAPGVARGEVDPRL